MRPIGLIGLTINQPTKLVISGNSLEVRNRLVITRIDSMDFSLKSVKKKIR